MLNGGERIFKVVNFKIIFVLVITCSSLRNLAVNKILFVCLSGDCFVK